jgi:hypothetical protein
MIELKQDQLVFSFPDVHPQARLAIEFQRTLRIPDDDKTYPLPPGLGRFPLRHVDDHAGRTPPGWLEHGGVMLPMYQAEALWLYFAPHYVRERGTAYPFAIKVATGKIDAVTGKDWSDGLHKKPQDYMVAPGQPWLDGYCVEEGVIRQFVAMPLGAGYTAEEQLTGKAEHGGLQIVVYPMKREAFERRFPVRHAREDTDSCFRCLAAPPATAEMGLAPGGRMRQQIFKDPYGLGEWHTDERGRCFVHIAHSQAWQAITGERPPTKPPTARQYTNAGLPWFDYYDENAEALGGSPILKGLKSVFTLGREKRETPLPENASVAPNVIELRAGLHKDQVREGSF